MPDFGRFLKTFYRAVVDEPLDADDPRYVALYAGRPLDEDPIRLLGRQIELQVSPTSAHLLSGYRGSGKSTELRRLRALLTAKGYVVVSVDMDDYLNRTAPIDITDLVMVLAGALGDAVAASDLIEPGGVAESWWQRLAGFFQRTSVQLDEVSVGVDAAGFAAGLKANLRTDPSFQRRLQAALAGHVGSLVDEVHTYVGEIARAITDHTGQAEIVYVVDSIEHLADTASTGTAVQESLQVVFAQHAEALHLPGIHTVYTIPPHLQILERGRLTDGFGGGISTLTAIRVRDRHGDPADEGRQAMRDLLDRRMPEWSALIDPEALDLLIDASGGHLRDFTLLLREVITRATAFSDDARTLADQAIRQVERDFRLITTPDAQWLSRLSQSGRPPQDSLDDLTRLAQFSDLHLVLAYRNHEEWYGVHPLAQPEIRRLLDADD